MFQERFQRVFRSRWMSIGLWDGMLQWNLVLFHILSDAPHILEKIGIYTAWLLKKLFEVVRMKWEILRSHEGIWCSIKERKRRWTLLGYTKLKHVQSLHICMPLTSFLLLGHILWRKKILCKLYTKIRVFKTFYLYYCFGDQVRLENPCI